MYDAKERLLKDLKFFWAHRNEKGDVIISYKDSSGEEYTSGKIKTDGKSLEDVKSEFIKSLKFTWGHLIKDE